MPPSRLVPPASAFGFTEEAARFRDWLKTAGRTPNGNGTGPLQLMYGIDGRGRTHGGDPSTTGGLSRLAAGADRARGYRQLQLDI